MNSIILRNGNHTFRAWCNPQDDPHLFKIALTRSGRPSVFRINRPRYTSAYIMRLVVRWDRLRTARRAYLADRNAAQDALYADWDAYRRVQSDGMPI